MRDRREVDLVKGDEFVSKEVQCPAGVSFWGLATGESDEVGFGVAIHFDIVFTVGLAAMNRREPSLGVGFARFVGGFPVTADVLTDLGISEPVVSLQENPCSVDILSVASTTDLLA